MGSQNWTLKRIWLCFIPKSAGTVFQLSVAAESNLLFNSTKAQDSELKRTSFAVIPLLPSISHVIPKWFKGCGFIA